MNLRRSILKKQPSLNADDGLRRVKGPNISIQIEGVALIVISLLLPSQVRDPGKRLFLMVL